ncbi:MAG: hypothetical protein J0H54_10000 [Rhizobiales bacterium]|nr:hypothetical protein [Hyphomicrobiales bacterium]
MADRTERLVTVPIGAVTTSLQLLGDGLTVVLALGCRDAGTAQAIYKQLGHDLVAGAEPYVGALRLSELPPAELAEG